MGEIQVFRPGLWLAGILLVMTSSSSVAQVRVPEAGQAPALDRALSVLSASLEWTMQHQVRVAEIPAPPFHEGRRASFVEALFRELGLEEVHRDAVGNVLGLRPGLDPQSIVLVTAHIDTVFPPETDIQIRRQGNRWVGPGIADNAAGVAAMLTVVRSLQEARVRTRSSLLFVANVGEEGEGNLRGMQALFEDAGLHARIRSVVVIDGSSSERLITQALGSRRYEVIVRGPGGHSWADFGLPNPIQALARAITRLLDVSSESNPRSVLNLGEIRGGTSVNAVPTEASMKVDIRSEDDAEMERLETALREAVSEAVMEENAWARRKSAPLEAEVREIGHRPSGELPPTAGIVRAFRAVDDHLGIRTVLQRSSTDANVPISLGIEAVAVGAGGRSGSSHSLQEWYEPAGRELALKRILLGVVLLAGLETGGAE